MDSQIREINDLYRKGSYEEVLKILESVYEVAMLTHGRGHPRASNIQCLIARIYKKQRKYKEAYRMYKKIHKKRVRSYGLNHPLTLYAWNKVALMLCTLGKSDKALTIYKEIYAKRRCLLGPSNIHTLRTRSSIANILSMLGKNVMPIYEEIYNILKKKDPERNDTLMARINIAKELHNQNKHDECLQILTEVYLIQRSNETMHLLSIRTMELTARVYLNQGKYDIAKFFYHRVFKIYGRVLGENDPKTLNVCHNIGIVLYKQKMLKQGLSIFNYVYNKRKVVLGEENQETLFTFLCIAKIYYLFGMNEIALSMYCKVYQIRQKLRPKHENTYRTYKNIAEILMVQGKYDQALSIYRDITAEVQNILRPNNPHILELQNSIAKALSKKGDYNEALCIFCKVDEIQVKDYGPKHYKTLDTQLEIATMLLHLGKHNEAIQLCNKVLKMLEASKNTGSHSDDAAAVLQSVHLQVVKVIDAILGPKKSL